MTPDLPSLLERLLAERKLSVRAAARLIGLDHAYLLRVTKGTLALPRKHIEKTADALRLEGEQREGFILSAHIRLSPPLVRDYVRQLETK